MTTNDKLVDRPGDSAAAGDSPAVAAARMLGSVIATCRSDSAHRTRAEVDLRAVLDIQRRLAADPADEAARKWARQLAQSWSFRARDNTRSIRRILDLLEEPGGR